MKDSERGFNETLKTSFVPLGKKKLAHLKHSQLEKPGSSLRAKCMNQGVGGGKYTHLFFRSKRFVDERRWLADFGGLRQGRGSLKDDSG